MLKNEFQSLMQSAKDNYLENLIHPSNTIPKSSIGHLKQLNQNKIKPNHIVENGNVLAHPHEKAESFNKCFNSTFTSSSPSNLLDIDNLHPLSDYISQIEVTRADIFEALCSLDFTKSFGCDNIHPQVLKLCATSLLEPIHHIFQLCLSTSTLPREWKIHKIAPLPKTGDLSCVNNCKPISLLCIFSKILESIIYIKIISFIRPKLSKTQFGFTKGKSCLAQLPTIFSTINQAADSKKSVDVMYFDFEKAFDSVPHEQLLFKLWQVGIIGPLWNWFRCYLTNGLHCVTIDGYQSSTLPVTSAVPQGSILGPLLFLIYINDGPSCINYSHCLLLVDDAKIFQIVTSFHDQLLLQIQLNNGAPHGTFN